MRAHFYLAVTFFVTITKTQFITNRFVPTVRINEDNRDDIITETFNDCKCVIFYMCDEQNFIIPPEELKNTKISFNVGLRSIRRLTCSNNFYFCCKEKDPPTYPSIDISTKTKVSPYSYSYTLPTILTTTALPYYRNLPTKISYKVSKVNGFSYPRLPVNNFSQSSTCGQANSPYSTISDELPWTVSIFNKRKKAIESLNNYSFKCGGSLIHPRVVLTAQHCIRSVRKDFLKITAGSDILNQNSANVKSVSKIIKHDQYYSGGMYNDVALLILEEPFVGVNSVCLTGSSQHNESSRCFVVKWTQNKNKKKELRKIDLPMVDAQTCENLLKRSYLGESFTLHSSFLCAGGEEGKDTCVGDGGMPLMCVENNRHVQVGITSWGVGNCGKKDQPGVYTDVSKFKDWIDGELKKEGISNVQSEI